MTSKLSPTVSANLLCVLSMMIWAAGISAADRVIPLLLPEQLNALRMGLSALFLAAIWWGTEGFGPIRRANWIKGTLVGSLIGLGAWFLVLGQARGGAVTVAVISATMPVVGIALEVILDGRRLTLALVLGLTLAVAGGFLALDFAAGGPSLGLGALYCFASVISFTLGSRLTVTAFPAESPLGRTAISLIGATIATLAVVILQTFAGVPLPSFTAWGWPEVGALLLFSVGAVGIAQWLFVKAVGRIGIGFTTLHMNATPFYVMMILFAAGGSWNWTHALAAAIVGLGVLIAQGIISSPQRSTT
jgi:drug/metabolite transporter (DMT)-like permease